MPDDTDQETCPKSGDETHCQHWWDGGACCACQAPAMTDKQKIEQGMDLE